jgi:hypothetical protein
MLSWGAHAAAAGELQGSGALGPVEGFGLDVLETAAAGAGLARVRDHPFTAQRA